MSLFVTGFRKISPNVKFHDPNSLYEEKLIELSAGKKATKYISFKPASSIESVVKIYGTSQQTNKFTMIRPNLTLAMSHVVMCVTKLQEARIN